MAVNVHLFHNIMNIVLPFKAMFGRVIIATAQSAWWTILIRLVLIIMNIILMILVIIIASIIGPTSTTTSVIAPWEHCFQGCKINKFAFMLLKPNQCFLVQSVLK